MVNWRRPSLLFGKAQPLNPLQSQSMSCELETTTRSSESIGDSSNSSFLQLSRENIEKISELTSVSEPLNPHQCRSMLCKLKKTMRSVEHMVDSVDDISLLCGSAALENFYRVSEKARQLVEDCCRADWWQASAFQIQNEEAFREILLEAGLSYNTIFQVVDDVHKKKRKELLCEYLRETATFNPSGADEVHKDRVALQERLSGLVEDANFSMRYRWLAQYLLGRVTFVIQHSLHEDCDVQSFNQWAGGERPEGEWGAEERLGGSVYKTAWLDVPCARKVFEDEGYEEEWLAEAKVLASLNHPNIVKFLCCNKYRTEHCSGHYIAMEQMETSLATFIKRLRESGEKLSLFQALDVIMQIAYGLCYLHDHGVAHRDLKTSNVVVRKVSNPRIQYRLEVKLADFGVSKVKLRAGKSNTITRPKIGTTVYMPPEAFTNGRADWFKADVYSFSVMCSVILSCREPFQHVWPLRDVHRVVCSGQRPELPGDTPKELVDLIKESWATDRKLRPSSLDICLRLEKLRDELLRFDGTSPHVRQEDSSGSDSYIERMLKRRSETRECDWSYGRVQTRMSGMDEEECLDGDQVQETIVEVQEMAMQEEEQDDSSTKSEEVEYTSPDIAEVDLEAFVVFRGICVLVQLLEDNECNDYVISITAQLLKNLVEVGTSELVAQNKRTVRRSLYDGSLPFMTKASIRDYKARVVSYDADKRGQSRRMRNFLRMLVEETAGNWTYAILWNCSWNLKLRWCDGYYKGFGGGKLIEPKHRQTAEYQLHRKKVLGELQALVLRPGEEAIEDVSDTEWFYLVSMAHTFASGEGTPGQALKSREPVWLKEANKASIEVCTRAHLAKMARIQTIVCVPFRYAVVELGSTDLIPKRLKILERIRKTCAFLSR